MPGPETIFALLAAAVVAGAAALYYQAWRRRKDIEAMAQAAGLGFSASGPEAYSLEAGGIELFRLGHSRDCANLVSAGGISLFDYAYVTGRGRSRSHHEFTVAYIERPALNIPAFDLKPETLMYKIGELVGFKDIDFPAFPLFSDKYRLTGPDEAAVHLFFTPERTAWFERNLGLHVQGGPGGLALFLRPGRLPASEWPALLERARVMAAELRL